VSVSLAAAHRLVYAGPAQMSQHTARLKVEEKLWDAGQRKAEITRLWGTAGVQRAYTDTDKTYLEAVRGKSAIHLAPAEGCIRHNSSVAD
jgi:hypothetical protein